MRRLRRAKVCHVPKFAVIIVAVWAVLALAMTYRGWVNNTSGAAVPLPDVFSAVGAARVRLLQRPDVMVDLRAAREYDTSLCPVEPAGREQPQLLEFLRFFTRVFRETYNNLPWWMDEGSLIGIGRAGAVSNADDDFDFFVLLPNTTSPCRPGSLECTPAEFNALIHRFLLPLWKAGACIHWFHPDPSKYDAKMRLMYSLQLHRRDDLKNPLDCFDRKAPLAHMHLGMLNADGELETNKWVGPRSHPRDKLPLNVILPVQRCRMGTSDAPCPNDIVSYLKMRNEEEYVRRSSEGRCLLVKKRWSIERKQNQVKSVRLLHDCGYNSMIQLVKPLIDSGYATC
ncbi:hypothetical protein DQ04_09951020 [Trypanosoma grayi]|uniref:hypothetical protein n=1 Tax=Trypanosoma grayi TaxID=71804 RepID=UPI0004F41841|nr:hypothetical protein DQ04_09951020 [Trypanosoma grayi]KEG07389.1 hypothetical protein DQ04_09951020 [Trypanosoma grayi]